MKKPIIAVTDCSKYDNYAGWISKGGNADTIRIGYRQNNFDEIKKCHGILLTGGEDVHPRFYNKPEYLELCYQEDMDERRDDFEWKVLEYSQANTIPVLGICRGLQIANVFFGGTLVPDIPTFGKFNHSKRKSVDRYHTISIDANSDLYEVVQVETAVVNSAHHQCADRVGKNLVANAISNDRIIEGLEWQDSTGKPYLCLVQWHPERMTDQNSPMVKNIKENFLDHALRK
jgi:putative glutamine amidotransferase